MAVDGETIVYVYDGQSVVAEKDGSGNVKAAYTIGRGEVISRTAYEEGEPVDTIFFLYDPACNVNAIVDEEGNLLKRFDYDVFGAVRDVAVYGTNPNEQVNRLGFCGGIGHFTDLDTSLVELSVER